MSQQGGDRLVVIVAAGLALLTVLVVSLGIAYMGAVKLRDSQVQGCERGKLDRRASVQAWTAARQARLQTARDPHVGKAQRAAAREAAAIYLRTIHSLRKRLDPPFDCTGAFPAPSPF